MARPEPTAKTPQPVNTASPNMTHSMPFQMPPPMHGMPPNMMYMAHNPNQNMSMPFMGQMVMMPQMGMRPPFMIHAPMHPQGFAPHPGMQHPMRPEMGEKKPEPGQSGPAQPTPVSTIPPPANINNEAAETSKVGGSTAAQPGQAVHAEVPLAQPKPVAAPFHDPAIMSMQSKPFESRQAPVAAPKAPQPVTQKHPAAEPQSEPREFRPRNSRTTAQQPQGESGGEKGGSKEGETPGSNDDKPKKEGDDTKETPPEGDAPKQMGPAPIPAKKAAEEIPLDIIIETDLSLRKRLQFLSERESSLVEIGATAIETYEDIFAELEAEIEKAEQQTLEEIDQFDFSHDPDVVSYTKDRDIHIMKEKNPDLICKEFNKYMNNLLRTDIVVRPTFRKDAYFRIHSFQWKSRQIHTYNLVNGNLETTYIETTFNIPLFSRSIVIENGDIYLTGGLVKPYYLKTTFFFDEGSNSFIKKADMNLPRADHSLIYLAGYIYAVGSYVHNKCNNTCERYDIYKNKWTPIASLNVGRAGVGLCSVDNAYLYAFGGRNEQRVILPAIEVYNIATDEWKEVDYAVKDTWIPCYMSLAHQITENEILVFGGKSAKTQLVSKESYIFNIETGEFKDGPPLRNPSSFMNAIVSWKDHLYVFGNDVYIHRFSLTDQSWSIKDKHNTNPDQSQKWL